MHAFTVELCWTAFQGVSAETVCRILRQIPALQDLSRDLSLYIVCDIPEYDADAVQITLVRNV